MSGIRDCKGRFRLSRDFVDKEPNAVKKIMGKCVIVRAEMLYMEDCIEYFAYSEELFRKVDEGCIVPEYAITAAFEGDEIEISSREIV